jgi:isochorismate hydrolase
MIKEEYFTRDNSDLKCNEWTEICSKSKRSKNFIFNLESAALLVLDMQNFFLDPKSHAFVPSSPHIITNIKSLIQFFVDNQSPIIFSRHISDSRDEDIMSNWWRDTIQENEEKSYITNKLDTSIGNVIIKHQYSAFFKTNLHALLEFYGVSQLVITGVLTHLCCETTARDAFMNNFQVFFLFDATATYNEQLHLGTLHAISHGFGICLSTQSILESNKISEDAKNDLKRTF